jgi:two-component sensor histidine kinase
MAALEQEQEQQRAEGAKRKQFSRIDGLLSRFHREIVAKHPILGILVATAIYAAVVLLFGERLAISNNYFVILPILVAALAFQLPGGMIAGFLGLPANLLLFLVIGHPEFSPASKAIAELSGILVGTGFGFLADYFGKLEAEIEVRIATEESLRRALEEKELLLQEIHHRVKNNLNIIKSLASLQRNRSKDPAFLAAADDLVGRIQAVALVHEQLYGPRDLLVVDAEPYLSSLVENVVAGFGHSDHGIAIAFSTAKTGIKIPADVATPLSLIVNEVVTNAVKHAFLAVEEPRIELQLSEDEGDYRLRIEDNGQGLDPGMVEGLGFRIIRALSGQIGGSLAFSPASSGGDRPGNRFELSFHASGSAPEAG